LRCILNLSQAVSLISTTRTKLFESSERTTTSITGRNFTSKLPDANLIAINSVWCNDEHELYDLTKDPHQLNNLLLTTSPSANEKILDLPVTKVAARLDSLLFVLKSCKGERCAKPWQALHPAGDVSTLADALSSRFDVFYEEEQVRIKYNRCEYGYIIDAEGPQFEGDGLVYRDGIKWSEWT
jgi:hypothetical protein